MYVGVVKGVERLGIPDLRMNDGPEGFRDNLHPGTSTQWPSGLTVAHSWDPALFEEWGKAMGEELGLSPVRSSIGAGHAKGTPWLKMCD